MIFGFKSFYLAGTKFKFEAPFAWNQVQNELSLMEFVALNKLEVICK